MAKSLSSEEAEIFNLEIVATQTFPILVDTPETLLKRREETLELTPELGFWFGNHARGVQGF